MKFTIPPDWHYLGKKQKCCSLFCLWTQTQQYLSQIILEVLVVYWQYIIDILLREIEPRRCFFSTEGRDCINLTRRGAQFLPTGISTIWWKSTKHHKNVFDKKFQYLDSVIFRVRVLACVIRSFLYKIIMLLCGLIVIPNTGILSTVAIFIRPSSDGSYYGMVMSVRPSVRVSVRVSVRHSQFSALFSFMLWRIELAFGMSLSCYEHSIKFECRQFPSSFVGVMPLLELKILEILCFPQFSPTCLEILLWNFAYDFFFYCTTDQVWVSSISVKFCRSYAPFGT